MLKEGLHFIHELVDIFELSVDGSKPYIGNLVEFSQGGHHLFTDPCALDLFDAQAYEPLFYGVCNSFEGLHADRPFFTGLFQSGQYLCSFEGLPPAVFLDDHRDDIFHAFVGGETLCAFEAFTPAAYRIAFPACPRVDYFVFYISTERTLHTQNLKGYNFDDFLYCCLLLFAVYRELLAEDVYPP